MATYHPQASTADAAAAIKMAGRAGVRSERVLEAYDRLQNDIGDPGEDWSLGEWADNEAPPEALHLVFARHLGRNHDVGRHLYQQMRKEDIGLVFTPVVATSVAKSEPISEPISEPKAKKSKKSKVTE